MAVVELPIPEPTSDPDVVMRSSTASTVSICGGMFGCARLLCSGGRGEPDAKTKAGQHVEADSEP